MPRMLTTRTERAERLLRVMSDWWAGRRVAEMAAEHHVSRQLVYRLLTSTRCDWRLRRRKWASQDDGSLDALPESAVAEARGIVEGRFFTRLHPRQRGAVAWRASGIGMWETARRMGSYPSIVRDALIGAMWKVERLTRESDHRRVQSVVPIPGFETGLIEIEDLLGRPATDVEH